MLPYFYQSMSTFPLTENSYLFLCRVDATPVRSNQVGITTPYQKFKLVLAVKWNFGSCKLDIRARFWPPYGEKICLLASFCFGRIKDFLNSEELRIDAIELASALTSTGVTKQSGLVDRSTKVKRGVRWVKVSTMCWVNMNMKYNEQIWCKIRIFLI